MCCSVRAVKHVTRHSCVPLPDTRGAQRYVSPESIQSVNTNTHTHTGCRHSWAFYSHLSLSTCALSWPWTPFRVSLFICAFHIETSPPPPSCASLLSHRLPSFTLCLRLPPTFAISILSAYCIIANPNLIFCVCVVFALVMNLKI